MIASGMPTKLISSETLDVDALRNRIATAADPVGILINVANGEPLRFVDIDSEGNAVERLEHVTVAQRLTVLRELRDCVLPKVSRNDVQIVEQRKNKDWNELVASRARQNETQR